jgi:uncharacterized protein (DUF486 family)
MENKTTVANFLKLLLDYSSNQMKKTQNKEKITLNIFKKVTSLHLKKSMKKTHF